ncbi:MAG: hypothetical protein JSV24_03665 [Bacteroidales bacterium]|nr:MAG: hypothetical protein JSV24_03665 [Bacteroidales bacterium]
MKKLIIISSFLFSLLFIPGCNSFKNQSNNYEYIISKKNGRIILAYKAFIDFLKTDKSWDNYNKMVLNAYPEVQVVHDKQLSWGVIDSVSFPNDIKNYKIEDFEHFLTQYDTKTLDYLYDSIIIMAHSILPPVRSKQIDLCFFLPYGSCFVSPEEDRNTIYISMWINPDDIEKIMVHEYGHVLHFDRKPEEPLTLKREIISEGMAVYLTNQIIYDISVSNSVPFMPENSFNWCIENEQLIKDSIRLELNDTSMQLFTRYISDGSIAKPPEGFVQKTAYFVGYRIIEECIGKGMELEEICEMKSEEIIEKSGYFN